MGLIFVSATRLSEAEFRQQAPLFKSLDRIGRLSLIALQVFYANQRPLADCYNEVIEQAAAEDILVFVHDDVWIDDFFIATRLAEALRQFDVVGLTGNQRRQLQQVNWFFAPDTGRADQGYLSGAVSHGQPGSGRPSVYGPVPAEVKLMDGVFLAVSAAKLKQSGVRFDRQFAFDFYDTDFCRSCEQAGLKMGTWPIAITHASGGNFNSAAFKQAEALYWQKWPE